MTINYISDEVNTILRAKCAVRRDAFWYPSERIVVATKDRDIKRA
jgi:hypothetical protein